MRIISRIPNANSSSLTRKGSLWRIQCGMTAIHYSVVFKKSNKSKAVRWLFWRTRAGIPLLPLYSHHAASTESAKHAPRIAPVLSMPTRAFTAGSRKASRFDCLVKVSSHKARQNRFRFGW